MAYQGDDTTGFQSPAQDYVENPLDVVKELGLLRPGLYPVWAGEAFDRRGIKAGDVLITDAAIERRNGMVCVAFLHGERVLAELVKRDGRWWVKREGREPVEVTEDNGDVEVWSAVTALVRRRI